MINYIKPYEQNNLALKNLTYELKLKYFLHHNNFNSK